MQGPQARELLGYVQLTVGSKELRLPICARLPEEVDASSVIQPLAEFMTLEDNVYAIVVDNALDRETTEEAVEKAAEVALAHLSKKLLN